MKQKLEDKIQFIDLTSPTLPREVKTFYRSLLGKADEGFCYYGISIMQYDILLVPYEYSHSRNGSVWLN